MTDLFEWLGHTSWWFAKIQMRAVLLVLTGLVVFTIVTGL